MKQFVWISIIFILSLNACSESSKADVDHQLDKTGEYITQESYQKATERIRVVEDWWQFQRSHYTKKEAKKVNKLIRKVETSLAIPNKKKAKKAWQHLLRQWRNMNQQS